MAHIGGQNLTVNLRRDVNECDICPPKANGCNCRGRSFSQDNGLTWSNMELDPQLHDPICEGSIVQIGPYTAFSNPPMSYARANMSIALSTNGGRTWDYRLKVTDEYQYTDYSSLVNGELIRGEASTRGGTEPGSARLGSARYTYGKKSQKARLGLGSVTSWLVN